MMGLPMSEIQLSMSSHKADRAALRVDRPWAFVRRTSSGFTFVEVLFAIIILGIGMIMIAGILPVAIKQQADTREDMTAKAVCEAGYAYLAAIAQTNPDAFVRTNDVTGGITQPSPFMANDLLNGKISDINHPWRSVGKIVPLNFEVVTDNAVLLPMQAAMGSRVSQIEPRYQSMAFYRRDEGANVIKLMVVAMKLQNTETTQQYGPPSQPTAGLVNTHLLEEIGLNNGPFMFEDVQVFDQRINSPTGLEPDRISFFGANPLGPATNATASQIAAMAKLAPGTFVIVACPNNPNPSNVVKADSDRANRNNGKVFRLGQQRLDVDADGRVWDLDPLYDASPLSIGEDGLENTADDVSDQSMLSGSNYTIGTVSAQGDSVKVWVIGRGVNRPNQAFDVTSNRYAGAAQDVGVLVREIEVK